MGLVSIADKFKAAALTVGAARKSKWVVQQSFGDFAFSGSLDDTFFSLDTAHARAFTIECVELQPNQPLFDNEKEEVQAGLFGALRYIGKLAAKEKKAGRNPRDTYGRK